MGEEVEQNRLDGRNTAQFGECLQELVHSCCNPGVSVCVSLSCLKGAALHLASLRALAGASSFLLRSRCLRVRVCFKIEGRSTAPCWTESACRSLFIPAAVEVFSRACAEKKKS